MPALDPAQTVAANQLLQALVIEAKSIRAQPLIALLQAGVIPLFEGDRRHLFCFHGTTVYAGGGKRKRERCRIFGMRIPVNLILDATGDGSGSKDGAVNGSVTPVVLQFVNSFPARILLDELDVFISDATALADNGYGGVAGLTNGVDVEILRKDGRVLDLLDGVAVKSHGQYCRYGATLESGGSTGVFVSAKVPLAPGGEQFLLDVGDTFRVRINDDLTGLTGHQFCLRGRVDLDYENEVVAADSRYGGTTP